MLVDKYKPLRFAKAHPNRRPKAEGIVRQPTVSVQVVVPTPARPRQEIADAPLLPSIEGHRPWHTTFKAPSHAAESIKLGNFAPSSARSLAGSDDSYERTRRTERELAKRKQQARRLSRARESTLDYRLGMRDGGLVEDRIQKAQQFDKVKGRGQPIARLGEERNPFITREEFLMNRIV
ncbi:hypothetical protein J3R83DRAFT_731 [Lanmaoa asiatica]|nr:hypothetical protein J3R83DRAFT_731 [Lanmaoa asiatica]